MSKVVNKKGGGGLRLHEPVIKHRENILSFCFILCIFCYNIVDFEKEKKCILLSKFPMIYIVMNGLS